MILVEVWYQVVFLTLPSLFYTYVSSQAKCRIKVFSQEQLVFDACSSSLKRTTSRLPGVSLFSHLLLSSYTLNSAKGGSSSLPPFKSKGTSTEQSPSHPRPLPRILPRRMCYDQRHRSRDRSARLLAREPSRHVLLATKRRPGQNLPHAHRLLRQTPSGERRALVGNLQRGRRAASLLRHRVRPQHVSR